MATDTKSFANIPSWSQVEQDPRFQELDLAGRKSTFDNWYGSLTEAAVEDPTAELDGWSDVKKFAKKKRDEFSGLTGLSGANAEAEEEVQTEAPSRIELAARKRELEAKMGGDGLVRLEDAERTELSNLRSMVSPTDEEDLDVVEKVANDDAESHVADGKFFASPSLVLDTQKYRDAVKNTSLTPEQKVDALSLGRKLREDTGTRLKADIDAVDAAFEDSWMGGLDKFRAFESDIREGNPDATDADIMERWQKENGAWYSNLGTQMKIGALQGASQIIGAYYGLKGMAGMDTDNSQLMAQAATGVNEQLAGASKSTGGATLAADATSMIVTSLATAPAGLAGRGVVAAGRGLVGGAGRFAAAATAGRVGGSALIRAATIKAGGEAAAKIAARQLTLAKTGGLAASAFAAGMQSAGGAFNQYFDQFLKEELGSIPEADRTPQVIEEARRRARDGARGRALVSGAVTAVITAGFGATGAEKLAAPQVSRAAQAAREGLVVFLGKSLSKEALSEAGEEGLDALANGIIDKLTISPGKPVAEIIEETLKSAVAGGLLGAGMSAPFAVSDAFKARAEAKSNPVVAQLEQTADDLRKNGASAVAGVVSDMAKTMTQEQFDQKAADAQAAAEAALNQQQPEVPPVEEVDPALQAQFDEASKNVDGAPPVKAPVNIIPAETPAPVEVPPAETPAPEQRVPIDTPDRLGMAAPTATPAKTSVALTREKAVAIITDLVEGGIDTVGGIEMVAETQQVPISAVKAVKAWWKKNVYGNDQDLGIENGWADKDLGIDSGKLYTGVIPTKLAESEALEKRLKAAGSWEPPTRSALTQPAQAEQTPTPEQAALKDKLMVLVGLAENTKNPTHIRSGSVNALNLYQQQASVLGTSVEALIGKPIPTVPKFTPPAPPQTDNTQTEAPPTPQPTPPQTDESQTEEPPTSSIPPVAGQPPVTEETSKPKTRAAPRSRQSKPRQAEALTPREEAVEILREEMFKNNFLPTVKEVSGKIRDRTGVGISYQDPTGELKQITEGLLSDWNARYPSEQGTPDGTFTGAKKGPEMRPTKGKSKEYTRDSGGEVRYKVVNNVRVGFFTNIPLETAMQLNAGLKVNVPADLRGKLAPGITINESGDVVSVLEPTRNVTVRGYDEWSKAYKTSPQRQAAADAQLRAGDKVKKPLETLRRTIKAKTLQLRRKLSPEEKVKITEELVAAAEDIEAILNSQNPRIPRVGTEVFVAIEAPVEMPGERAVYTAYSAELRSIESIIKAKTSSPYLSSLLAEEIATGVIYPAVMNQLTVDIRKAIAKNPQAKPKAIAAGLKPMDFRVKDVVEQFRKRAVSRKSIIAGTFDSEELSKEVNKVSARVNFPDDENIANTPITPDEIETLRAALQKLNDGEEDVAGMGILLRNPFLARQALAALRYNSDIKFKVGAKDLIFEHGPPLSTDESESLSGLLKGIAPEGNTSFVKGITAQPNLARFLLEYVSLGRDVLKTVVDTKGRRVFSDTELQEMNLYDVAVKVRAKDDSLTYSIIDQASLNLKGYSSGENLGLKKVAGLLKTLLLRAPSPVNVAQTAAPSPVKVAQTAAPTEGQVPVAQEIKKAKEAVKKERAKIVKRPAIAPTVAINKGLSMAPIVPAVNNTPEQKMGFVSELSAIGLSSTSDISAVPVALNRLSVKENSGSPHFKALARVFADKPSLLNGLTGVQMLDDASLAEDVSVINGVLTLNVAAMTPTADGTPRAPEALLRGLITHATKTLTSPDAILNDAQRTALEKLEALRQEAIEQEANTRPEGLNPRFTDALKDTASFMQSMLTSPSFAEMLRSYQTKQASATSLKSPWGRFWAAVGELLSGKPVAVGSGLHAGLMAAGNLMTDSPAPNKLFLDSLKAVLHNPQVAFPAAPSIGATEAALIDNLDDAVELADSTPTLDSLDERLAGKDADPEGLGELDTSLQPDNALLGSQNPRLQARATGAGRLTAPPTLGGVTFVPLVKPQAPATVESWTDQVAYGGLEETFVTVDTLDKVARGVLTTEEAGAAVFPAAIQSAINKISVAIERLKGYPATNKDQYIEILEDMKAFLELDAEQVVAVPAITEVLADLDTESLPAESELPLPEPVTEEEVPYAEPYVETTTEAGAKESVDLTPFLRIIAAKAGREIRMIEAGEGIPNQPLFVKHDRGDTAIYVNKSALETLVAQFKDRGYSTEELTTHLNALLDREASTLAILQRFSSGELVATAMSLSYATRRQIIKRVYGLTPQDPGYQNYFNRGTDVLTEDAVADMVQLGADYFRMMRQISETGHTTEDVLDMVAASPGTFARTVAFMRATSRQFMAWWRAYGDIKATKAILNIDAFLEAASPSITMVSAPTPDSVPLPHEVNSILAKKTGRTIEEVVADAKLVERARNSMELDVLKGDTPETTQLTSDEARQFVTDLGLVGAAPDSVATALANIAEMENVNPAIRAVALELSNHPSIAGLDGFSFFAEVGVDGASAFYEGSSHSIGLVMPFMLDESASAEKVLWSEKKIVEALVHEAAHAATANVVRQYASGATLPANVSQAITGLEQLRGALAKQEGASKFAYQLSNLDEFIAGVMANEQFVSWVATLPNSVGNNLPGETGNRSLINRILHQIYKTIFPDMEMDSVLEKSLSRIFDISAHPRISLDQAGDRLYSMAPSMSAASKEGDPKRVLGTVTGERKRTEALKNSLPAMPARVATYLEESTYFSGNTKVDADAIEKFIGPALAAAVGPADFYKIFMDTNSGATAMTGPQRQLSLLVIGEALNRRVNDLTESLAKTPSAGGFSYLRDFEDVAGTVWRTLQDVLSDSGQMLNVGAIVRERLNPKYISKTYRDAATKVNGKKLPKEVDETFNDLQDEADKAAVAVVKKSPLTKKIVESLTKAAGAKPEEVKKMFDFMTTMQDYIDNFPGTPVPSRMADWVANQMLGMVDENLKAKIKAAADKVKKATGAADPEQTFFEEYSNEVKRLVAERIDQAMADAEPKKDSMTEAERAEAKKKALDTAIRELQASFEFAPSVERALNQSRAKLLTDLEAEKGSTPEALKLYEDAKAAISGMFERPGVRNPDFVPFDFVSLDKATQIVRNAFDMRDQIYLTITDRNANVMMLAATITNATDLTAEQAAKVAESFKTAYEAELNRRIQRVMKNYAKRQTEGPGRGDAGRYSRSERFLRLALLGGLRKEEFYNAMATEFELPSYDPVVADELDREAARIIEMPAGSVQRADATRDLNARVVSETYKSLMDVYGAKAIVKNRSMTWEYLAGIPVAMWKAGVLSGFGTAQVNFGYGTFQSILDLGFNSVAYATKAKDPKLAAGNMMILMKAVGWMFDPVQKSDVWNEVKRAALTGRTRFGSEQSENMLVLERDVPAIDAPVIKQLMTGTKDFFKLLGRIGSVIDATVSVPASIARQRLALSYALTLNGADRAKIADVMRQSFTPDELVAREINEILESEREQFRNTARPDLAMESRRAQLMDERRTKIYEDLTSRVELNSKEDFMEASRESARFANLGTTPTGVAGWIFDGIFGAIDRKTKGLSSIIVSFPRAMGNLLDFSLAMSAPGLALARAYNVSPSSLMGVDSKYRREEVTPGSLKFHKMIAQAVVATIAQTAIGLAYWYGLEDEDEGRVPWFMVYGKGYIDSEKNRQLRYRQPDWSPYTLKMGDVYLSWKDLPGINLILGGLASITDWRMETSQKDPGKLDKVESMTNAAVAFIKAVTVKNSMQGLAQAGELISDNNLSEAVTTRNLTKMVSNFVSGATNPRLLRDVTEIGRGLVGGGEYTLKDTRGFTAAAISLLPANTVYGSAFGQRDMLNSMGRPVTNFWFAPLTKRMLPVSAGDNLDPVITPLATAGLFISPVKASQMSFDTYKDDSDEIDVEGGPLSRFGPEVEMEAIQMFGDNMTPMMTPELIKDLTDQAAQGRKGKEEAQDRLNDICKRARADVKAVIQERIFARELLPDWQQK